jgi:hypothetical protein
MRTDDRRESLEELCERLRAELGVVGFPGLGCAERLIEREHPRLQIKVSERDLGGAMLVPRAWGHMITLPAGLEGWAREEMLVEEYGHWLLQALAPELQPELDRQESRRQRGYDGKNELTALDFKQAWLLADSPFCQIMATEADPFRVLREHFPTIQRECLVRRRRMLIGR